MWILAYGRMSGFLVGTLQMHITNSGFQPESRQGALK